MRYNPVQLVVDYLKTQPELSGVTVAIDMTGHTTGSKRVALYYGGGYRSVRDRADYWDLDLNVFAKTRTEAIPIVMSVREILLERVPGMWLAPNKSVHVGDLIEVNSPFDSSDTTVTGEVRYIGTYSMFTYM